MSAIEKRVIEWIKRHQLWAPEHSVLLGVSGGMDSMVMMTLLARTQGAHKGNLRVVTIDHGLRFESQVECQHVVQAAEKLSLPVAIVTLDLQKGPNLQATARAARQDALLQFQSDRIATAHHQDDQAETVLYRFLRGSGTIGLSGLAPLNRPWCRPILCLSKADVKAYALKHQIDWFEDPSNPDSLRGRLREIIPALDELHGGAVKALVRSSQICAYDDSVLTEIVDDNWTGVFSNNKILTKEILNFRPGLQLRFLYRFFALHQLNIRFEVLERIMHILESKRFSTVMQINGSTSLNITPHFIQLVTDD